MKYIQHNSIVKSMPTFKQTRLQKLQARLDDARKMATFGAGATIYKVYNADGKLVEFSEDTGWVDKVE